MTDFLSKREASDSTYVSSSPTNGTPSLLKPATDCVPPDHPWRTLVLCFDGTGDQYVSVYSSYWWFSGFFHQVWRRCGYLFTIYVIRELNYWLHRTQTSSNSSVCSKRMTQRNSSSTIRWNSLIDNGSQIHQFANNFRHRLVLARTLFLRLRLLWCQRSARCVFFFSNWDWYMKINPFL